MENKIKKMGKNASLFLTPFYTEVTTLAKEKLVNKNLSKNTK